MGSSLRAGLAAPVLAGCSAVVLVLVDQPGIRASAVRAVADAHRAGADLAVARYEDGTGHPVLLGRPHWDGVAEAAEGDVGARPYLATHADEVVTVDCTGHGDARDADTPAELTGRGFLSRIAGDTGASVGGGIAGIGGELNAFAGGAAARAALEERQAQQVRRETQRSGEPPFAIDLDSGVVRLRRGSAGPRARRRSTSARPTTRTTRRRRARPASTRRATRRRTRRCAGREPEPQYRRQVAAAQLPPPGRSARTTARRTLPSSPCSGPTSPVAPTCASCSAPCARARVLVPVLPTAVETEVGGDGRTVDKVVQMATVTVTGRDGRRALPVFTSTVSMAAWDPAARPFPTSAPAAAAGAFTEGAEALLVDFAGPFHVVVEGAPMRALAEGRAWVPADEDPEVRGAVQAALADLPGLASVDIGPRRRRTWR